jgi:hypothetical protein
MIGVGTEINARHRWEDAAENIGVTFDPGTGAELGGLDAPGPDQAHQRRGADENCCLTL